MNPSLAIAAPGASALTAPSAPPTRYRGTMVAGWILIAATLGGLGAWSALAPLSKAAIAHGTVSVDGNRKTIQHLSGGIIAEILVRDGDHVEAGQSLIRLDGAQAQTTAETLRSQRNAAAAAAARLRAERAGADTIAFPAELLSRQSDPDVAELLQGEQSLFDARRQSLQGQIGILRERIAQSEEQIRALEYQRTSNERQTALLKEELGGMQKLQSRGYAPANKILAYQREIEQLNASRGEIMARIAGVRQTVAESELQIAQLSKTFREQVETGLRENEGKLIEASERLRAVETEIARLDIKAPVTGEVVDMAIHTRGGVITPGSRILDLVPSEDTLVIEAQMPPDQIDGVHPGEAAEVRFPAFNQRTTPTIYGKVTTVSADRLTDPRTGAPYYEVRVEVNEDERPKLARLELIPGMPAEIIVAKGEGTLLDYLTAPLREIVVKALRE